MGKGRHLLNAAAFVDVAVGFAANAAAAHSQRPQAAIHLLGFLFGQLTGSAPNQYSAVVVHNRSPFHHRVIIVQANETE
jgi:hypothetical protein